MHKIVLTSSAMRLFDVIKNYVVINCTWKNNGSQSWATSFPCIHTDETWRRSHENQMTDAYGANCVSHWTICGWIEGFWAGKVSFEDGHCPGRPVSARTEQTVHSVKKDTYWKKSTYNCKICERGDVSIGTAEKIVHDDLNLEENRGKIDTPSPNRPAEETES